MLDLVVGLVSEGRVEDVSTPSVMVDVRAAASCAT